MKVELERSFPVPAPAEIAWEFLQDIESVAGCMPGAKISERTPAGAYKGSVAVKLGPAKMSFRGELELSEVEPAARSLRLVGKGTDSTGSSGAAMDLLARIDEVSASECRLVGKSEVSMSGKAASFGGRMMNSVADQILGQFAGQFAARVAELAARSGAPAGGPGEEDGAQDAPAPSAAPGAPPAEARELNGLALLWAALKDWLRGLFGKSRA